MKREISAKQEIENQLWLIANNKEAEFEFFCKTNDLKMEDPFSLKMFINEETVVNQQNDKSSFYHNGFFVRWADLNGQYRIFTKSGKEASMLTSLFASDNSILWVEKYCVKNGEMNLVN